MDLKLVIELIIKDFDKEKVRYALIGGFALGALGIARTTVDLDFLLDRDDLSRVDKIMKVNGYKCVFKTENVSQYVSEVKIFGEVDFIHAFRKISIAMLRRAKELDIFEGKSKIKVLRPEDIIGLKLQAVMNDRTRRNREFADIEALMDLYRKDLDWESMEEYFSIFNQKQKFTELKKRYCNADK